MAPLKRVLDTNLEKRIIRTDLETPFFLRRKKTCCRPPSSSAALRRWRFPTAAPIMCGRRFQPQPPRDRSPSPSPAERTQPRRASWWSNAEVNSCTPAKVTCDDGYSLCRKPKVQPISFARSSWPSYARSPRARHPLRLRPPFEWSLTSTSCNSQ